MIELDKRYPEYGFAGHKGYPTKAHFAALEQYGAINEHRKSFKPVQRILAFKRRATLMPAPQFVHLRVHSDFSMVDGLAKTLVNQSSPKQKSYKCQRWP